MLILLMFFGLLRGNKVLTIKRNEVVMDDVTGEITITYRESTKTRLEGFGFIIPAEYKDVFVLILLNGWGIMTMNT